VKRPWWQHEAAIAWALILFFPLGLWLMWKHAPWRPAVKWGWTAAFARRRRDRWRQPIER
jgi:hypothetical protein